MCTFPFVLWAIVCCLLVCMYVIYTYTSYIRIISIIYVNATRCLWNCCHMVLAITSGCAMPFNQILDQYCITKCTVGGPQNVNIGYGDIETNIFQQTSRPTIFEYQTFKTKTKPHTNNKNIDLEAGGSCKACGLVVYGWPCSQSTSNGCRSECTTPTMYFPKIPSFPTGPAYAFERTE